MSRPLGSVSPGSRATVQRESGGKGGAVSEAHTWLLCTHMYSVRFLDLL